MFLISLCLQQVLNSYSSNTTNDQDSSIETYQSHVRAIKHALHTLTDALDALHRRLYPKYLHHGLASLPNDLLLEIFAWSGTHPLLLRAVSRRFYQLVAQSPSLWAYYPVDISVKKNDAPIIPASTTFTLSHCGTLPLHLHINDIGQGLISLSTLELLAAHAHRAHTLEYLFDLVWARSLSNFYARVARVEYAGERRRRLEFPRMKRLRLIADPQARRTGRYDDGRWYNAHENMAVRFTQHWYAPVLEDLTVSGAILPHHILGSTLTRCTLYFATAHYNVNLTQVTTFLASSNCNASLRELKLVFGYSSKMDFCRSAVPCADANTDTDSDTDIDTYRGTSPALAELSALTTFTLSLRTDRVRVHDDDMGLFPVFLSTLHTPNLSTLNLELNIGRIDISAFHMRFILPFIHKNVNTEHLSLSLGRTPSDHSFDLPNILGPLRRLKHLTIEVQCMPVVCHNLEPVQIPSELETLVLRRCFTVDGDFIKKLAMNVCRARTKGSGGDGGEREEVGEDSEKYNKDVPFTIVFEGCPHLDRRTVETKCLYEGTKGVWRDTAPDSNNGD
jgi:hypothetical protein